MQTSVSTRRHNTCQRSYLAILKAPFSGYVTTATQRFMSLDETHQIYHIAYSFIHSSAGYEFGDRTANVLLSMCPMGWKCIVVRGRYEITAEHVVTLVFPETVEPQSFVSALVASMNWPHLQYVLFTIRLSRGTPRFTPSATYSALVYTRNTHSAAADDCVRIHVAAPRLHPQKNGGHTVVHVEELFCQFIPRLSKCCNQSDGGG